jgi:hypothetical protein
VLINRTDLLRWGSKVGFASSSFFI